MYAVANFLDLSKAYDLINHKRLLDKLDSYGIRGIVNKCFQSNLANRIQFVEISHIDINVRNQCKFQSSLRTIKHGVQQGSVLGPLLFVIYINDLLLNIQGAKLILYANDTNVLITDRTPNKPNWETLTSRRKLLRICALFKAYFGVRAWKPIGDRLKRPHYLSRIDHVWKIRCRKQRRDIGKFSFANRTIQLWNQLPAVVLGNLPCKQNTFKKRVRKAIIECN